MLSFFFFNDTATTEIYTLSLHDALPISHELPVLGTGDTELPPPVAPVGVEGNARVMRERSAGGDRKSTRLNSSHSQISYAVFCLKKKKRNMTTAESRYQKLHTLCVVSMY